MTKPRSLSFSSEDKKYSHFVPLALSKKAATMLVPPSYMKLSDLHTAHPPRLTVDDILFRRHFNQKANETQFPTLTKQNSFHGLRGSWVRPAASASPPRPPSHDLPKDLPAAIVVVDCFSTGAMVAHMALVRGYKVINLSSFANPDLASMIPSNCRSDYDVSITYEGGGDDANDTVALEKLVQRLADLPYKIECIVAGAETGVTLTDRLSEAFISFVGKSGGSTNVLTNGSADTESRRNKFEMGEQVRNRGVRAVKQVKATTWNTISNYIEGWNPCPFEVIVKPMESAGSDDVTLCRSLEEVKAAFSNIMGKVNSLGMVNEGVLVQEYLSGTEYVVDTVSKNGSHKCVALWEYDRRPTNGAGFVLHGQKLLTHDEPRMRRIVEYHFTVLDALNIKNSPGHGEVKWFQDEPVLVEVGSRCHGAEGMWMPIADEVYGYNQVQVCLDTFLNDNDNDNSFPEFCGERHAHGGAKFLISYLEGCVLDSFNEKCLEEIKNMSSFRAMELFSKPGSVMKKTIDCFTWCGCVLMANKQEVELNKDYARIEEMCKTGEIFNVSYPSPAPTSFPPVKPQCVAVVDPFSTGAVLAAELCRRGYRVICVYSATLKQMENLLSLVPEGVDLSFDAIVGQKEEFVSEKRSAVYTAGEILRICDEKGLEIISVMPGAETGVCLSERVADMLELRTNGVKLTECRRNKFLMNERVKNYYQERGEDIRVVKQLEVTKWDEGVTDWLMEWNPTPFQAIVKPMESAGSDDVKLCKNIAEVRQHCEYVLGKSNQLGLKNMGVLVQEFLEGTEYVVDTVSRDGVSKCVGLWQYHKEAINGHTAPIVYFGQKTLAIVEGEKDSEKLKSVVEYQKRVLTALNITQGPAHAEIKLVRGEPCLVEVGSRCHGAEACWRDIYVESHGEGNDQVSAACDSILDEEKFKRLPDLPPVHKAFPRVCFIVSYVSGILIEVREDLYKEILGMQSFRNIQLFVEKGKKVMPTTDSFTFVGQVTLCHVDESVVEKDYERIHEIENNGFLVLE